jgi:hypothetical protein
VKPVATSRRASHTLLFQLREDLRREPKVRRLARRVPGVGRVGDHRLGRRLGDEFFQA